MPDWVAGPPEPLIPAMPDWVAGPPEPLIPEMPGRATGPPEPLIPEMPGRATGPPEPLIIILARVIPRGRATTRTPTTARSITGPRNALYSSVLCL